MASADSQRGIIRSDAVWRFYKTAQHRRQRIKNTTRTNGVPGYCGVCGMPAGITRDIAICLRHLGQRRARFLKHSQNGGNPSSLAAQCLRAFLMLLQWARSWRGARLLVNAVVSKIRKVIY